MTSNDAASHSGTPGVLDSDTLDQLLDLDDGGTGLVEEMLQIFRDDTPPRLDLLDLALKEADWEQVGDTAHALKGAAATMGASRMRHHAQLLETLARKGQDEGEAATLIVSVKNAFVEALDALVAFLTSRR